MPRKPLPPPPIFRLEGLSDGIDRRAVDDFTGLPPETVAKPVVIPVKPSHKGMSAVDGQLILQATGMLPMLEQTVAVAPKMVAKHIPGKRVIGIMDGSALYVVMPAWRRL